MSYLIPFNHHPLTNFQNRISHLLDDFFENTTPRGEYILPLTDVSDEDKEILVKAELPGLEEKDIKLEITDNNMLVIKGEKKEEKEKKGKGRYYMKEISQKNFYRSISLPFKVDSDKINADFAKGVLSVHIPKPEGGIEHVHTIKIATH
jgi:HSP20 family protein